MEKFTKGEWYIDDTYSTLQMICAGGVSVCDVECGYNHESSCIAPSDEEKANANLIVAAPEMYRMLKSINFEDGMIANALGDEFTGEVVALLAKARGE